MPVLPQAAVDGDLADPLPQRILLVETRAFTGMLREAIEQRLELPVVIATLARPIAWQRRCRLVSTGLVLAGMMRWSARLGRAAVSGDRPACAGDWP